VNAPEPDRIAAIRARHADRLRTHAAKGPGAVQMSTLVDDDMRDLLAEVDRLKGKDAYPEKSMVATMAMWRDQYARAESAEAERDALRARLDAMETEHGVRLNGSPVVRTRPQIPEALHRENAERYGDIAMVRDVGPWREAEVSDGD